MSTHGPAQRSGLMSPVELPLPGRSQFRHGARAVHNSILRASLLTVLLVSVDVVALVASTLSLPLRWALVLGAVMVVCRGFGHLYRRRLRLSFFDDLPRDLSATLVAFGTTAGLLVLVEDHHVTPVDIAKSTLLFLVSAAVLRAVVFQTARWSRKRGRGDRTLVVGASGVGVDLARKMIEHPEFGLLPIGFVDDALTACDDLPVPLLGTDMAAEIMRHRIGTVILAFANTQDSKTVDAVMTAQRLGCTMFMVPRMYELVHDAPDVERLRSYPLIRLTTDPTGRPTWWVKRAIDLVFSAVLVVLVAPVLILCAIAVLLESGRPIIFEQERVGLDGRPFLIYKFRSLRPVDDAEAASTWSVAGDPRIGPVGRFLRRSSLDELPQLWNVLRGNMSLVGPRPERPGFVQEFSATHERYWARHRVPSGLTGLAQISGLRGNTSIHDRASFDNYYIANWSLWLDLKILMLTVREVVRRGQH